MMHGQQKYEKMSLFCWKFVEIVQVSSKCDKTNGYFTWKHMHNCYTTSSIGTTTLVGFGLFNYRWVFSAGRFLHSAVASGTSNPQPGWPVIRTFQLPPPGVPSVWTTQHLLHHLAELFLKREMFQREVVE